MHGLNRIIYDSKAELLANAMELNRRTKKEISKWDHSKILNIKENIEIFRHATSKATSSPNSRILKNNMRRGQSVIVSLAKAVMGFLQSGKGSRNTGNQQIRKRSEIPTNSQIH